jgi:lipopolysaccharide/colanic/teichoic acid biosynthesis glycosyltransferase
MDYRKKIEHDLYYADNFRLWQDEKVFFKTVVQVVGAGAI